MSLHTGELVLPSLGRRIRVRGLLVGLGLTGLAILGFAGALASGQFPLGLDEVFAVLTGGGDRLARTVVFEWRLARAVVALAVGLALGLAGALSQSLARNPLASPDVMGISMGASAAAVGVLMFAPGLVIGGVAVGPPLAALFGGFAAAVMIALLARGAAGDPLRLVLIGVGINALAGGVVTWLLVRGEVFQAAQALAWLNGTLTGRDWGQVAVVLIGLVIGLLVIAVCGADLPALSLGDEAATGLGVPIRRIRGGLWLAVVLLTAVSVAAAGPIGFIALAAPQIARLIFGTPTPPLVGSALTAAVLVLGADIATQAAVGDALPVGVLTSALGGPFLLVLLVRHNRKVTL